MWHYFDAAFVNGLRRELKTLETSAQHSLMVQVTYGHQALKTMLKVTCTGELWNSWEGSSLLVWLTTHQLQELSTGWMNLWWMNSVLCIVRLIQCWLKHNDFMSDQILNMSDHFENTRIQCPCIWRSYYKHCHCWGVWVKWGSTAAECRVPSGFNCWFCCTLFCVQLFALRASSRCNRPVGSKFEMVQP